MGCPEQEKCSGRDCKKEEGATKIRSAFRSSKKAKKA
jgi:hypothetical protein